MNQSKPRSPGRLTILQVTQLTGVTLGPLRADPTFPPMWQGTFDEAAVHAWKQNRDAQVTTPEVTK